MTAAPQHAVPTARPPLTYADCWNCRGRQSFWLTLHFGYRLGALLALLASRIGCSPGVVTLLSFLTNAAGVLAVAILDWSPPAEGLLLFLSLQLAYGLDCADGVLARVTHRTSTTGFFLDKTADLASALLIPGILGFAAASSQPSPLPPHLLPLLLWWSIAPRILLTSLIWIKDSLSSAEKRSIPDPRPPSTSLSLRKAAGNLIDDITFRSALALSWATSSYWLFVLIFHSLCFLFALSYAAKTIRHLRSSASS